MELKKEHILFFALGAFFICNALIAEFIGTKLFSLEESLGFKPLRLNLFGNKLSFTMTAGVILWPFVFITTDIINEYYGRRGVKLISFITAGLIAYAFIMVFFTMGLTPDENWRFFTDETVGIHRFDMEMAYDRIFGQGLWIIVGSLVAFLLGQFLDVAVFHSLKKVTGKSKIWLRATGSTLVSQFVDSFVVLLIAFYLPGRFSLALVIGIGIVNYIYKFVIAIALTPLLYLIHAAIDRYLGHERAEKLMKAASFR